MKRRVILALLAARAGAQRVIAVENSPLADLLEETANKNGFGEVVQVRKRDLLQDVTGRESANVIVCELLGQFGIDEDIVHVMRRYASRNLAPGGSVIPRSIRLIVAPVSSPALFDSVAFWRRRHYGLSFQALASAAASNVYVFEDVPHRRVAPPSELVCLDLRRNRGALSRMECTFQAKREANLHGFVGWFDAELADGLSLSGNSSTHWDRVFFPLNKPVQLRGGSCLRFSLRVRGQASHGRWKWFCTVS